jgi:hypothetical protein
MTSPLDKKWHAKYGSLPDSQRRIIDNAFDAARKTLASGGFKTAGDGRAEALVAGITRYALAFATDDRPSVAWDRPALDTYPVPVVHQ